MDTRTPRRPLFGGGSTGIDAGPGLDTVKVESDPARLSSTQASFRLRLGSPVAPLIEAPAGLMSTGAAFGDPYANQGLIRRPLVTPQVVVPASAVPALAGAGAGGAGGGPRRKGRVTAVTWTGQAPPGDLAATRLLEAVQRGGTPAGGIGLVEADTQVLPSLAGARTVPRQPRAGSGTATDAGVGPVGEPHGWTPSGELPEVSATDADGRQPWYPGRRVDLGLVLLPLRAVLGSLSVYAGFSKLCDPVYFDGGERGSMMRWLSSLHPWKVAEPLLAFAMAHPVGAGLAVSFTEIVVGVLTILGLWQRLAAGAAMLLSAALLFTVSWRAVPVYDTPDLIFLAAWSPLLIAGAPFASLDGRLNLEAWRRIGADAPGALRRRVLRRGTVVTTVVVGLTLLLGSMLGAAVRSGARAHQAPNRPATDYGTPVWPAGGPSGAPGGKGSSTTPSPATPRPATPTPSTAPTTAPAAKSATPTPSGKAHSGKPDAGAGTSPAPPAPAGGAGGSAPAPRSTPGPGGSGSAPKPSPSSGSGLLGGVLGSAPLADLSGGGRAAHPGAPTAT
ncbi:putative membrane protein YphA (DoxX/SURF4 family) [Streptomyces sp. 1114.5]|uniref:DoxX family membrane protein n=1 Tax=Streptomyces sp. 1114.5 TaxID=1938830 RepID=UPI000F163585|nr:DoxX family membrane protein [Streptomyces sp. 1114.5]RKT17191.1 putative membrane protein YphA (DoxX/SURF4 family) [Streptomyces sp. 1114.5]